MSPQERAIFRFYNGTRWVWADPLLLSRRLDAALGDPDAVFKDMRASDAAVRWAAMECFWANFREVFGMLPAIDPETGQGVTLEECEAAWRAFDDFWAKKKHTIATPPTSSTPTASVSALSTTTPSSD